MKTISFLSLFVLVTPLVAQDEVKPVEKTPAAEQQPLTPNQQAFLNLPEENRKEFIKHLGEAQRLFQQKRIFETMDELNKGAKIFDESQEIYNLRGSCFVEIRAFDKALAEFEKARSFTKENPSLDFNIAEVLFCTKEWKKSLDLFDKIGKSLPKENIAFGRLVEFKMLLCKKKLGMAAEVAILAEKYDFNDDSPYHYYAKAILAYDQKDLLKAEEWLAIAGRVFQNPGTLEPWQDTLVEYGYIKSFYGGDTTEAN